VSFPTILMQSHASHVYVFCRVPQFAPVVSGWFFDTLVWSNMETNNAGSLPNYAVLDGLQGHAVDRTFVVTCSSEYNRQCCSVFGCNCMK